MDAHPPPPSAAVVTPEAVPLELQHANVGSRALAFGLDLLIQAVLALALFFGLAASLNAADASGGLAVAAFLILLFLVILGYPVILETVWRGRTVGKAAVGLRVVTVEGAPVGFRHAAIRASLGLVDFYLTWGAAAVLSVLLTRDNQRLGDLAAGTFVLRERTGLRALVPMRFSIPWGMEAYAAVLDVSGLGGDDYRAARAFLVRAPSLPFHVRADLAMRVADPLASRVRPPPPAGTVPELFLACVAAVYQARQAPQGDGGAWPGTLPPPPVPNAPPSAPTSTPASAPASTEPASPPPAPPPLTSTDDGFLPPA